MFVLRGAGARDRRFQMSGRVGGTLEHRLEDKELVWPSGGGGAHRPGREQGQYKDTARWRETPSSKCMGFPGICRAWGKGVIWTLQENRGASELGGER